MSALILLGENTSSYNFWILRRICRVPLYHPMEELLHPVRAVPQTTFLRQKKNVMINKQQETVSGYRFETAGEEKIPSSRLQRRVPRWQVWLNLLD